MAQINRHKLTLDRPAIYQIRVPGELTKDWLDWIEDGILTIESDSEGMPLTLLTVNVDQAALQGLLRRLYSIGVPLISVLLVDVL